MGIIYKERIIDKKIIDYLNLFGAILISGPKWCGKTSTGEHHANTSFFLSDPKGNFSNKNLASVEPSLVLQGEKPRLIDEWQDVPAIWDAVRFEVDRLSQNGQFILTGSSTPKRKGIKHSGAGRIAKIKMRTLSLYEQGFSSGEVSLKVLCENGVKNLVSKELSITDLINYIIIGGWPANLNNKDNINTKIAEQYINSVLDEESFKFDGKRRSTTKFKLLLKSIARNDNTMVSIKTLNKDISNVENGNVSEETISEYIDILERLYLIENIEPFSQKVRSRTRVRISPKIRFVDPSITCALLNVTKDKLLGDLETLGILFESLCYRDLLTYADSNDYKIYHYHDYENNEIDAICELNDSKYVAIEIKLGANQIENAAKSLIKFKNKVESDGKEPPKRLIVLCGLSNASYKRPDGVEVVAINHLKD
ncbi:MAG: ATP-binding protein [Lachnospiraceae bacterium]|nr:ATP-binding protein [Lachnospiraceae bacterium]